MKTTKSITIDAENWQKAEIIIGKGNISSYLNKCLAVLSPEDGSKKDIEESRKDIRMKMAQYRAKLDLLTVKEKEREMELEKEKAEVEKIKKDPNHLTKQEIECFDYFKKHCVDISNSMELPPTTLGLMKSQYCTKFGYHAEVHILNKIDAYIKKLNEIK